MKYWIFAILIHSSIAQCPSSQIQWIIWNVGQGQWITRVSYDSCQHFDFGGETFIARSPLQNVQKICHQKINQLYLSHADLDHYSFLPGLYKRMPQLCWQIKPLQNLRWKFPIPYCSSKIQNQALVIFANTDTIEKNKASTVLFQDQILIPGDSPTVNEKIWLQSLNRFNIQILILGHHGSRTSTSQELLNALPGLRMTIASQRTKKYGHPHREVAVKLLNRGLRIIKTEDWGHILIQNP